MKDLITVYDIASVMRDISVFSLDASDEFKYASIEFLAALATNPSVDYLAFAHRLLEGYRDFVECRAKYKEFVGSTFTPPLREGEIEHFLMCAQNLTALSNKNG